MFAEIERVSFKLLNFQVVADVADSAYCLYDSIWFWLLVTGLAISEPCIISYHPASRNGIAAQLVILIISSLCFGIIVYIDPYLKWMPRDEQLQLPKGDPVRNFVIQLSVNFRYFVSRGDYIFESVCFLIGWIFLFSNPGIAALRCFRVFRVLWYTEIEIIRSVVDSRCHKFGGGFLMSLVRACRFAVSSLIALGREMFTLSTATHGGLLIGLMFFYTAFVMGIVLWVETGDELAPCNTLGSCMYVMMRLTFYDGSGFDFAYSLTQKHKFLFAIVMLYLSVTAFGMLNGLIGIFGTAFTRNKSIVYSNRRSRASLSASARSGQGPSKKPFRRQGSLGSVLSSLDDIDEPPPEEQFQDMFATSFSADPASLQVVMLTLGAISEKLARIDARTIKMEREVDKMKRDMKEKRKQSKYFSRPTMFGPSSGLREISRVSSITAVPSSAAAAFDDASPVKQVGFAYAPLDEVGPLESASRLSFGGDSTPASSNADNEFTLPNLEELGTRPQAFYSPTQRQKAMSFPFSRNQFLFPRSPTTDDSARSPNSPLSDGSPLSRGDADADADEPESKV